jgi:hypothetical protein
MRHRVSGSVAALVVLLAAVAPAFAHHSLTAEFDPDKEFTVTGTLTRVDWMNPHIYWYVDVKDDATGNIDTWTFEGPPPGMLHRAGITKDVFKIGQVVTVTAFPAKDGTKHLGFGKKTKYADGHEMYFNKL